MQIPENTVYLEKYGLYVCLDGRVFREAKRSACGHKKGELYEMNQRIQNKYLGVSWRNNGEHHSASIHRLKAEAFIPNPNNYPTVDHINRDKLDNRIENLRWVSWSEQNTNRSSVDRSLEKYGVSRTKNPKEYKRLNDHEYRKTHLHEIKQKEKEYRDNHKKAISQTKKDWYRNRLKYGKYVSFCDGSQKYFLNDVADELLKLPRKYRVPPT